MKLLITGGGGFLGARLARALLARGQLNGREIRELVLTDLGLRSNIDSTRALLDALRANVNAGGTPARLVFSSSVAVFGPDPMVPMPAIVTDTTLQAPQTSYGMHKLVCQHLLADYTRKGY